MYVAKPPRLAIWPRHEGAGRGVLRHLRGAGCGLAVLTLAGCSGGAPPGEAPAQPLSPTTYPDLASVPPRPELQDTPEQRRELQASLASAGHAADRRAAEVLYETGRGPAPAPLPSAGLVAAPPPTAPILGGDGRIARAYLASSLTEARDRGKLRQFMRRLTREAPDPTGPQTVVEALGLVATPPAAESEATAEPQALQPATPRAVDPLERFGIFDDDAFSPFR